ncbi:MAG: sugar nucleotide-binding protein, partial [Bacteroidetes bacterium]|nr:sugar nucleotide-binding protein [Bacteroidota bacterium]
FHVSGKEMLTPYQLGCMLANMLQLDASLLLPVSSDSLHEPAKRPPKTGFIITKAIRELGFVPTPLEEGLKKTFGLI